MICRCVKNGNCEIQKISAEKCPYKKTIEKGFSNLNELMEVQSKVQTLLKTLSLINELDKESFQFIIDTLIKESKWRKIDRDHYVCNECDYWTFEKTYFCPRCGCRMKNYLD